MTAFVSFDLAERHEHMSSVSGSPSAQSSVVFHPVCPCVADLCAGLPLCSQSEEERRK